MNDSVNPHDTISEPHTADAVNDTLPDSPPSRAPADQGKEGIRERNGKNPELTIHPTSATSTREQDHDVDGSSEPGDPSVSVPQPNPSGGPVPVEDIYRCFDREHDVGLRHEGGSLYSGTCHDCGTRYERAQVVPSARVDLDEQWRETHPLDLYPIERDLASPQVRPLLDRGELGSGPIVRLVRSTAALVAEVRRLREQVGLLEAERDPRVVDELSDLWQRALEREGTHTLDDVIQELLDTALTALCAVEHLTGNHGRSMIAFDSKVNRVYERAGLAALDGAE